MENPFESLEQKLAIIERKLDGIIEKSENPENSSPIWLSSKQLSKYLGISTSTVSKFRGNKIPYYKLGGRIFFKKQEIDELIDKTRHKTGGEYFDEFLKNR